MVKVGLRYDELLAALDLGKVARKVRLGFVSSDCGHGCDYSPPNLKVSQLSLLCFFAPHLLKLRAVNDVIHQGAKV